ncbi:MAG: class GN sortase [Marinobacter sp.]|nr:class GN sortase [Marinobacter sp.]
MRGLLGLFSLGSALLLLVGLWIPAKAVVAQQLLHRAWAETQASQTPVRPWPWADTWPVARLTFPDQGQSLVVLAGTDGGALAFAPGHLTGSALPGAGGEVVIAGHRDTHFALLRHVATGERIDLLAADGGRYQYRVQRIAIVNADQQGLDLLHDRDRLILVTCYPFDATHPGGPLRYVIEAERVDGQQV